MLSRACDPSFCLAAFLYAQGRIKPDNVNGWTSVVEYRRTGSLTEKSRESFERFFLFLLILLFFLFLACRSSARWLAVSCWSGNCAPDCCCLQSRFNLEVA